MNASNTEVRRAQLYLDFTSPVVSIHSISVTKKRFRFYGFRLFEFHWYSVVNTVHPQKKKKKSLFPPENWLKLPCCCWKKWLCKTTTKSRGSNLLSMKVWLSLAMITSHKQNSPQSMLTMLHQTGTPYEPDKTSPGRVPVHGSFTSHAHF